jgi:Ran-binding protein 9/10
MASTSPFGNTISAETKADTFFIPAHLEGSRYADQLRETHRARLAAQRDARSPYSSTPGSLSTSSSSVNLHKMVPSHRGMTHDIIERAPVPTFLESSPPPLPSKLNETDKYGGLELSNHGLGVKFASLIKPHDEAGVVRADYPIPKACGIYYFEATVGLKIKDG